MRFALALFTAVVFSPFGYAAPATAYYPYDISFSYTQTDLDTKQVTLQLDWQHAQIPISSDSNGVLPDYVNFYTAPYNFEPDVINSATCTTAGSVRDLMGDCRSGSLSGGALIFLGTKERNFGVPQLFEVLLNPVNLFQNGTSVSQSFSLSFVSIENFREVGVFTVNTSVPEPGSTLLITLGVTLLAVVSLIRNSKQTSAAKAHALA